MHSNIYLSKEHIGQTHSECVYDSNFSVFLINERLGTKTQIIHKDGTICNFPGVENCEALSAEISMENIRPKVVYSTTFEKRENGQFLMVWTVRPDGRFWMDSWGFGAEDYESLRLYSYIDETGLFTAPFRLHNIGYRDFFANP